MHALRPIALELPGMNGLIERTMSVPIVQAIVLDLNPFWMLAQRLEQAGLNPDTVYRLFRGDLLLAHLLPSGPMETVYDLGRSYSEVEDITRWAFRRADLKEFQPFLARIVTLPPGRRPEEAEMRANLVAVARETPFPTVVEPRAEPQPLVKPGDSCNAPGLGTIGGFVRDQGTGRVYGVTCGHVAAAHAPVTSNGTIIGKCVNSMDPFAAAVGPPLPLCRPNVKGVARLDMALIDTGGQASPNVVSAAGAVVQRGTFIELHVRGTTQPYEAGGVVVTTKIKGACFDRLFEIVPRPSSLWHPLITLATTTMPTHGDSGAWITCAGNPDWCGMLIAGEPTMGYALESDDLLTEANNAFGLKLVLA